MLTSAALAQVGHKDPYRDTAPQTAAEVHAGGALASRGIGGRFSAGADPLPDDHDVEVGERIELGGVT